MGSVYLANQVAVNRPVAIKLLENASDDDVIVSRFKREARLIAQLSHPNIVSLIDFGTDERGRLFLVMEYINGDSLKALIRREAPLDPARVVEIGYQILDALAPAHAQQIIHRDLKPDNVMLAKVPGRRDFVKLLDFGIAKIKRADPGADNTVQTKAGFIVGSLRYISPEQVDTKEITARTDLYSLGVILYELLTGRPLFDYESPADCAIAHLTQPAAPPQRDGRELRGPLVDFIMACLDKHPGNRPADAQAGLTLMRACRELPLVGEDDPPPIDDATLPFLPNERPTVGERDAHEGPTVRGLTPPPLLSAGPPSRPRPATARAPAPGGGVGRTDCALDTPRKLHEAPSIGARAPDLALARQPTRAGTGAASPSPSRAPLGAGAAAASSRAKGGSRLLILLALIGLSAIGAAIYVFIIYPATHGEPTATPDPPASVSPLEP